MSDFDAPSFSLGLDLDLDLEAPSFSLGIDLDLDAADPPLPLTNPPPDSVTNEVLEEDDQVAADSDPDLGPEPPRVLRRLRRGTGTPAPSSSASASVAERVSEDLRFHGTNGDDDDIEGFSSQEGIIGDVHLLTQYNSVCSTSKAPLQQSRILMTKSSNQSKSKKEKQAPHANVFPSMGTKIDSFMFPKLTSSPLRRFQLIDSDSDDSCVDIDMKGKAHTIDASMEARQSNYGCNAAFGEQSKGGASVSVPQSKDLWKDFCPVSSKIPTPAFDEVFEEYHSAKNKKPQNLGGKLPASSQKGLSSQNDGRHGDPNSCLPPAHYYFFNDDPRIQELVRSRLPNFFPLGVTSSEGNRQSAPSIIDYTCQFTNGETSKKPQTRNVNREGSSTRRKKSRGSSAKETSQEWVNPRQTASSSPKDAGKRRVQADGQSTGHWYSGAGGKKVYVNKNGQELTGRIAYQQYKKENGSGFKKSKKKTNTKKRKR